MAQCVACGAELEPPVRAPHTVYVKTLYPIGGQDCCRTTSSGPRWPLASSPRSNPAPDQRWPCPGERLPRTPEGTGALADVMTVSGCT